MLRLLGTRVNLAQATTLVPTSLVCSPRVISTLTGRTTSNSSLKSQEKKILGTHTRKAQKSSNGSLKEEHKTRSKLRAAKQPLPEQKHHADEKSKGSTPISKFFKSYGFDYDPRDQIMPQFQALRKEIQKRARTELQNAIAMQFNQHYGTEDNDPEAWTRFFNKLDIKDIPDTVVGCKELASTVYVSIVDVVDPSIKPRDIKKFDTLEGLVEYCVVEDKIYPRENVDAKKLLKYLLREIWGTYKGYRGRKRSRDGGGGKRGSLNPSQIGQKQENKGTSRPLRKYT
ncbi:hypothetical protein DL96DRAFT_1819105 [Flagelloscypha sp. PMI_526]|nr:hypothetical protein DL96DRAFT_1819105 [Flagelloscypha sp. PMI_526]